MLASLTLPFYSKNTSGALCYRSVRSSSKKRSLTESFGTENMSNYQEVISSIDAARAQRTELRKLEQELSREIRELYGQLAKKIDYFIEQHEDSEGVSIVEGTFGDPSDGYIFSTGGWWYKEPPPGGGFGTLINRARQVSSVNVGAQPLRDGSWVSRYTTIDDLRQIERALNIPTQIDLPVAHRVVILATEFGILTRD